MCSFVREPSAPLLRILGLLRIYIPAVSERVNVFSLVHVLCVCVYVFHFRISKYDTISLPHLPKTLLIYPYRHSSSSSSIPLSHLYFYFSPLLYFASLFLVWLFAVVHSVEFFFRSFTTTTTSTKIYSRKLKIAFVLYYAPHFDSL